MKIIFFAYSLLVSLFSILFAFYYQFFETYPPCELCIYQRIPYFGIICVSLFFFLFKEYFKVLSFLIVFLFIFSVIISAFHAGVELGFWNFKSACTNNATNFEDIDQLRAFLDEVPITKCDEVIWSYKGISMASYNFIFSVVNLIIITILRIKAK